MESEKAKEILAEIFRGQPEDLDDMIQRRLVERSCHEEPLRPETSSVRK